VHCFWCGTEAESHAVSCSKCEGSLEIGYDYSRLRSEFRGLPTAKGMDGIWRYAPLLPLNSQENCVSLGEGGSPFRRITKIGSKLGMGNLFVKDESRNPTCSFKDRKSTVAISKAIEDGFKRVVAATAGNAGSSVAAYAAKGDIQSYIFAFRGISRAKLAKLLAYGANVFLTNGSTGDVLEFTSKVCDTYSLQNCSAASRYNPYVKEGAKTAVFEMFEQGNGKLPDWIILPVGGGGNISAYFKGLKELKELGLIKEYPKLVGVQASGCAPVVQAFEKNLDPRNIPKVQNPKTIAHSILDDWAPDGDTAIFSLRETKGLGVSVSEEEIVTSMKELSASEGVYAEPSSATSLAALKKLLSQKSIDTSDTVALIVTGFGSNQPDATIDNSPPPVDLPNLDVTAFGKYLK
jgi:threonine synthase